ncbi:MAG: hypothetical protein JWQ73_219 [Variovorax sp.]|nr:hypothetical protein [Variovorax sp.]
MRVLNITPTFHPKIGGIEAVVLNLSVHCQRLGVDAEVLYVSPDHKRLQTRTVEGIKVTNVPLIGSKLVGYAPHLKQAIQGFDLLHVHDPQLMALSVGVMLSGSQLPRVLSTHGGFHHTRRLAGAKRLHQEFALRRMLDSYKLVLATSDNDAAYFGRFTDRIRVTGNGIDVQRHQIADRPPSTDLRRWVYWGRLSENKRVDRLLDYAVRLKALGHPLDLLITGTDVSGLACKFQARIDSAGLQDSVRLAPPMSDADLKVALRDRTVFATASEYEGFGLTLLEAMAAGLLVVCRDVEPMNGFVQSGENGLCLEFDGSDADFKKLIAFLSMDQPHQQSMRNASLAFAEAYDWPRIAQRFISAYSEVLSAA